MKVLKTIVATAVVVLALTTVAMAGARHFAADDTAPAGGPAATPAITLTDAQVQQLVHELTTARDSTRDRSAASPRHAVCHIERSVATHPQRHTADAQQRRSRPAARLGDGHAGAAGGHHSDGHDGGCE